jgi:sialic acid synthase SpsE
MSVLILAEIGSNHVGNLTLAKDLIASAAQCGADVVKFQAFDHTIWASPEEWEKRRVFTIDPPFAQECASFAGVLGLEFMCTPFYPQAVEWLNPLVKRWKVGSADVGNEALLKAIYNTGKQAFYSTGVHRTPRFLRSNWVPMICVSRYPAKVEEYALPSFVGMEWGLSDHTPSNHLAVAAVARGATVIEKHLKLDEQPYSPDRDHSLTPLSFKGFVKGIREIEKVLSNLECASPRFAPGRKVY